MSKLHFDNAAALTMIIGGISTLAWMGLDSEPLRKDRLSKLLHKVDNLSSKTEPYFPKEELVKDINSAILCDNPGGVKILWGIQGSGKTTTLKKELEILRKKDKINGVLFLTATDQDTVHPSVWFRSCLTDFRGPILFDHQKFSELLEKDVGEKIVKPTVIVIDQIDNMILDDHLRNFIRTLAEDSTLYRNYIVFVVTSDAANAMKIYNWNRKQKIVILGPRHPSKYRWNKIDIERWVDQYYKNTNNGNFEPGSQRKIDFIEAAEKAGTPGFLVANSASQESNVEQFWAISSKYYDELWNAGLKIFQL